MFFVLYFLYYKDWPVINTVREIREKKLFV